MPSDRLEKAKQLVGASLDQADATSYAAAAKDAPQAPPPDAVKEPMQATQPESQPAVPDKPDSPASTAAPTAFGFVVPPGTGQELVQLGVRIPADLRAALRTCGMMQQVEIQELVRDALERELRRRARA